MIAADRAVQRRPLARLLYVDGEGRVTHARRWQLASFVRPTDIVVANDAATLPASLAAVHEPTGASVEVRLAARRSIDSDALVFDAVLFGAGNFRTRTEHRPMPPAVRDGDMLAVGPLEATIELVLDHPRFVRLRFDSTRAAFWRGLAMHGRPVQYAHVTERLALWDVWTPIASAPVAYEPPSAGFTLDWSTIATLRARGASFATLTHAAGLSSTGDPALDRRFPLDEPYFVPTATAQAIERARAQGGRVIAIGTTVVRALEHCARIDGVVHPGPGLASQRIGADTRLRVIDAIVSGTHETGTSHYELLRAFVTDEVLQRATKELDANDYLTHEFGDSVLIERCGHPQPARSARAVPGSRRHPVPLVRNPAGIWQP